ncbi:hypothetical protein AB205_0014010, partial [Aquarana catesbeiana]
MDGFFSCYPLCAIVLLVVIGHSDHMVQTGPITAHLYHTISCGQSQLITTKHTESVSFTKLHVVFETIQRKVFAKFKAEFFFFLFQQSEKVKNVACMHFYKIIGHICKAVNENGNLFPPESSNTLSTTFSIAVKIHLFCSSQDISFTTVPKSKSIQDKEASNERKPLVDSSHRSHSSSSYPYTHNPSVLSYEPQHYPTQIQHPSHEVLAPSMVGEAHRPP